MEAVSVARVLVVELSAGQLIEDVRLAVQCRVPVFGHSRTGGMVPSRPTWSPRCGVPGQRQRSCTMTAVDDLPHASSSSDRRRGQVHALLPGLRARRGPPARAEVLEELGIGGRTIAVAAVGCAVFAYDYLHLDFLEAQHGRCRRDGDRRCGPRHSC